MKEENENASEYIIYMDNNATTRVIPEVLEEMSPLLQDEYGNPSSTHPLGKKAKQLLETARGRVAAFLNCHTDNIIFTSGGTESNNLAITGLAKKRDSSGHFITSNVEHPAVLEVFAELEKDGHPVTYLPVDTDGLIRPGQLAEAIREDTALVSFMMANNETGVLFPIGELLEVALEHGVPFHCDAVQGAGKIPIDLAELPVDLLSISGHKMHGPKGVGILFVRDPELISPLILGGGQEQGKRNGTEALPAIVGLGKACEIAAGAMNQGIPRIQALRDKLEQGILERVKGSRVNGGAAPRLCNTSNILLPGNRGPEVVEALSARGVCVSRGSACSACHGGRSHVLKAMGLAGEDVDASLRFSLSKENSEEDVQQLLDVLPEILQASHDNIIDIAHDNTRDNTSDNTRDNTRENTKSRCTTCGVAAAGLEQNHTETSSYHHLLPGLKTLHRETSGNDSIRIAILDGTVDTGHPCFNGAGLNRVESFVAGESGDDEYSRHGTHVTSIIFGQPGTAVSGVAPRCNGLILPIFREREGKILPCSQLDLARAINRAVETGAQVINISGGQFEQGGEAGVFLTRAIELCVKSGVLIVAAAGNDGCDCHHVPASLPGVLAVGAMNRDGEPMGFSNWGEKYRHKGILAPGENISGAIPGGGVGSASGTSYAAPLVSGVTGLLMSLQKQRGLTVDAYIIKEALLQSALPCEPGENSSEANRCSRFLTGSIDIERALNILFQGSGGQGHEKNDDNENSENNNNYRVIPASHSTMNESDNNKSFDPGGSKVSELNLNETVESMETETINGNEQLVAAAEFPAEPAKSAEAIIASEADGSCTSCGSPGKLYPSVGQYVPASANDLQKVYVLGTLGYDFGFEARKDNIIQNMAADKNPFNVADMLEHLDNNPWDAGALVWTLNLNTTPIYAVLPTGPFAQDGYKLLRDFLKAQSADGCERVSIPGIVNGQARLISGITVPVIRPDIRGMFSWRTQDLVKAVSGKPPAKGADEEFNQKVEGVRNLLDRIYYDIQNLGMAGHDRALNFAATNAFNVERVFENATKKKFQLQGISTEKSPVCRPESDCWDVKLTFFDPENQQKRAKQVYRYTVDVSDVMPVTVGAIRSWNEY